MALGRVVAQCARAGDVVALSGELGAGKTQFARGMAAGLGIDPKHVTSPTFVMVQEYAPVGEGTPLVHIDAYRLRDLDDLESIGWDRSDPEMRQSAVVVIEWADRISDQLDGDVLEVRLEHAGDHDRDVTLTPRGRWTSTFNNLIRAIIEKESEMTDNGNGATGATNGKCPTCGKAADADTKSFPFCSERCRTIDLGNWADEKYMISRPVEEADLDEE